MASTKAATPIDYQHEEKMMKMKEEEHQAGEKVDAVFNHRKEDISKTATKASPASASAEKEITWQELAKHNKPHDAWIGLYGSVYDISTWGKSHPGGQEVLNLVAGREATHIFESYHKLSTKGLLGSKKVPKVGKLVTTEFPLYTGDSKFYTVLRTRVEEHFKKQGNKTYRDVSWFNLFNTFFILGGIALCSYLAMYCPGFSFPARMVFAVLIGFFHHLSMVHLWHDLSHYCYSDNPAVWSWFGWAGGFFTGHNMDIWRHRHVLGHHIYTNVCGIDPDLGIYKASPARPLMKYKSKLAGDLVLLPTALQPFLYSFIVFQMQWDDVRSFRGSAMEQMRMNSKSYLGFWFPVVCYWLLRVFLPPVYGEVSVLGAIVLFMISEIVAGNLFGIFSQITHISLEVEWPASRPIPKDWAELQVLTARDYSYDSFFWTYISGYLNYQVLHHLFPSIAPHYYPELLPILRTTCKEFNVRHSTVPGFWDAVHDHFEHLKQFQPMLKRKESKKKTH